MKPLEWTLKRIRLRDLVEWEQNPVQISKRDAQELAKSLKKFGQDLPYVAAAPFNGSKQLPMLDGHQRKKVEIEVNHKDPADFVPVLVPSRKLTEKERQEWVVRHRKNTGEFDPDALLNWFESGDLLEWGFDEKELKDYGFEFGDGSQDAEPEIPTDRFEEVAEKWGTADGQLWRAGNHFIYCGDSLNPESIEIVLQDQSPVLIEADPPYGVNIVAANVTVGGGESNKGLIPFGGKKRGYVGGTASHIAKTGMTYMESNKLKRLRGTDGAAHVVDVGKYPVIIGDESTETAKKAVELYLGQFPDAYQVWWGANYYIESVKPSSCWLVWDKQTTGNFADCELAWTNAEKPAKLFTHRWSGMLRDSERERRWHPTQKPAALASWSFGLFTEIGDVILDPFGGAGWTFLAAHNSERKACVIEKSHEYVAVILERFQIMTGISGVKVK